MVWVNDNEGHEFVCTLDRDFDKNKRYNDLTDDERKTCRDVNEFIGTERW